MLFAGDGSSRYGGKSIEKETEKKKPQTFLLHLVCVCVSVEIGRQNCVLGERREKRTRTRENQPSDLCRLWAPPKSEKIGY